MKAACVAQAYLDDLGREVHFLSTNGLIVLIFGGHLVTYALIRFR